MASTRAVEHLLSIMRSFRVERLTHRRRCEGITRNVLERIERVVLWIREWVDRERSGGVLRQDSGCG